MSKSYTKLKDKSKQSIEFYKVIKSCFIPSAFIFFGLVGISFIFIFANENKDLIIYFISLFTLSFKYFNTFLFLIYFDIFLLIGSARVCALYYDAINSKPWKIFFGILVVKYLLMMALYYISYYGLYSDMMNSYQSFLVIFIWFPLLLMAVCILILLHKIHNSL